MRAKAFIVTMLTLVFFVLAMSVPCSAEDLQGCYHKKKGNLRILTNPAKGCNKSELPVTLSGTIAENPVPAFEGEICWDIEVTKTDPTSSFVGQKYSLRANVEYIGGGLYRIEGLIVTDFPLPAPGLGVAVYTGDSILVHFNASEDYAPMPLREMVTGEVTVATDTLSGSGWFIAKFYSSSGISDGLTVPAGFTDFYDEASFTKTACPE
jgi:hypothetical protein